MTLRGAIGVLLACGCGVAPAPAAIGNLAPPAPRVVWDDAASTTRPCAPRGAPAPAIAAAVREFFERERGVDPATLRIDARAERGEVDTTGTAFRQAYCLRVRPGAPPTVVVTPSVTTILTTFD